MSTVICLEWNLRCAETVVEMCAIPPVLNLAAISRMRPSYVQQNERVFLELQCLPTRPVWMTLQLVLYRLK